MVAKTEKAEMQQIEDGKYYDMLYDFTKSIFRINDKAADGERVKTLQGHCRRVLPAFVLLCGELKAEVKKPGPKPQPSKINSNLLVRDEWGRCPKCGGKCIKVKPETILVNYPMFCKHCKKESVVTWQASK